MRPYFRQVAGELVLGSVCGVLMNTAVVLPALLLGRAVDAVAALGRGESSVQAVAFAAALVVVGTLATELPRIGKRWWLQTANARIRASVRSDVFRGVVAWPMARLNRTPIGDLMARTVGDVEVLGVGVREFTIEIWDTVLFSISLIVAMLVIDPWLTLVALLPVPVALLLAHASGRWIAERTVAARSINAQLTTAIQEQLAGARVLRLFGRRAAAIAAVSALSLQQADANLGLIRLRAGLSPVYSTLVTAGIVAIVWFGGEQVLAGVLSVGTFVAYLELFGRFVGRAYRIPQLVNSVQSGAAAYERLRPVLAAPIGVAGAPRFGSFLPNQLPGNVEPAHRLARPRGPVGVSMRSATFRYPGAAEAAFEDLSLDIPAGAFVAITGPVGSGKSALARCIAGLYAPESGEICVDGVCASAAPPGLIGYAPQEGYLFSGSVRDNVFMGAAGPSGELDRVVDVAALRHDLGTLPDGIDTLIGELGVRISGGQRQRLGLARAAATSPGLLVLDDPFSAVDVTTEAKIVANLRTAFGPSASAAQRATVVLFSHRLGAFPRADRIVVLDRGRIVESGTHASLVDAAGLYARIYRAQLRVEGAVPLAVSSA